ncbi:crotonobetainyl-CoA:carnitine CoA-transferase CaiB-like acyl-CoA transferase [Paenibacillus tundrae]|uniref:Crotonobetainyl-CoA:carnitine CoA-transferase CaiB-like acyl-CoA transferase n=2 Tax=Paenibacillus tundrae TaxID=528187 RepID=A0ABT9WCS8_9BACL|nr:crotonobetainyl-CoA:carnitine CoA-transferase CaiB-like acyl-CoA transferase [Paenibacillus tundrae]
MKSMMKSSMSRFLSQRMDSFGADAIKFESVRWLEESWKLKRQKANFGVQDNPAGSDRYSHQRGDCLFILE